MPADYWDVDDPAFKAFAHAGGGRGVATGGGGGGGGGGVGGGGFSAAPPVFGGSSGAFGASTTGRKLRGRLQNYMQSYEEGGPVMGGPPGVDTVNASLNNGEGVLTTRAMSFPGVAQLVNVLNAIAALGGDPTMGGMPGAGPEPGEPVEEPGGEPLQEGGEYGLGSLLRGIPVVGKPLSDAAGLAAPLALQALGVPLPVGAALSSAAMEGRTSDPWGTLKNAGRAGVGTAIDMEPLKEIGASRWVPFDPEADPAGAALKKRYAYGGYVSSGTWNTNRPVIRNNPGIRNQVGNPSAFDQTPPGSDLATPDVLKGMFDPRGNQYAMEAARGALNRSNQANDRADIAQLQSLGLQDPNLAASFLGGQQQARARGSEEALAGISADQANRSQDFYRGIIDKQWQNYLDFLNTERQKQLKQTRGR